jgi:hypothetical protein
MRKSIALALLLMLTLISITSSCSRVVTKTQFIYIVEGSDRHTAILDSLQKQIIDCEAVLRTVQ